MKQLEKSPSKEITPIILNQEARRYELLMEINHNISQKKPLPILFNEIMDLSKNLMDAEASSLLIYDKSENALQFRVAKGNKGEMIKQFSVNLGQGIAGWVAENKESLLIEDCYEDSRFDSSYDKKTNFRTRSMVCVPLLRNHELLGVLQVINKRNNGIFSRDEQALLELMATQCAIAIDNERLTKMEIEKEILEQELNTAREIQQKALPDVIPEIEGVEISALLIPAKQVGGDYYHIYKIDNKHSLWVVSDVSGKGVPAALIVSTLHASIQTFLSISGKELDLLDLVTAVNQVLIDNTTSDKYATAWFGLFHCHEKKLEYVNAGHNSPLLYQSQKKNPKTMETGGLFLGAYPLPYEKESIDIKKGDVLVVFTDGVTEAWNDKEEDYDDWRLQRAISNNTEKSAADILNAIENDVAMHVDGAPPSDDFTCVVFKVK